MAVVLRDDFTVDGNLVSGAPPVAGAPWVVAGGIYSSIDATKSGGVLYSFNQGGTLLTLAFVNTITAFTDCVIETELTRSDFYADGNGNICLFWRLQSLGTPGGGTYPNLTGYRFTMYINSSGNYACDIARVAAGSGAVAIGSGFTITNTKTVTLRVELEEATFRVYANGTLVATRTDSTYTSGYVGFIASSPVTYGCSEDTYYPFTMDYFEISTAFTEIITSAPNAVLVTTFSGSVGAGALSQGDISEIAQAVWEYATRTLTASSDPSASTIASAVRSELSVELAHIDADISSRLPTASYVTPATPSDIRTELSPELTMIDELHKIQGLDIANPMTVTTTSREAGDIALTLSGDGILSTTVTRSA